MKQPVIFDIIYIVKKGLEKVKGQTEMKIYGLKSFVKKLEKRLVKEIDYKQEPFVVVDGIEISYIEGSPIIAVSLRVGYQFNDNHYQSKENIEIDVDGNNLEYIAGVFATKIENTEFEMY